MFVTFKDRSIVLGEYLGSNGFSNDLAHFMLGWPQITQAHRPLREEERPGSWHAPGDGCAPQSYGYRSVPQRPQDRFPVQPRQLVLLKGHYCQCNCGPLLYLPRRHVDRSPLGRTPPACLLAVVPPPGARVSAACALPSRCSSASKSLHPHASAMAQTTRARQSC